MNHKRKKVFAFFVFLLLTLIFSKNNISHASSSIGPWMATSSLPYKIASHTSFIQSGKISIIGGATGSAIPTVSTANVAPDSSLSPWDLISPDYPESIYWFASTQKDKYIYVLGGTTFPPPTSINNVSIGQQSGGIITSWSPTTPIPQELSLGGSVIVGNRIYYAGGSSIVSGSTTFNKKVYVADINPLDGTVGTWAETTPLPFHLSAFGMVETGNKIVIIGGWSNDIGESDRVLEASVNPDGTLSNWVEKAPLPKTIRRSGVAIIDNTIISVGGISYNFDIGAREYTNSVLFSEIDASGSPGEWQEGQNPFPHSWCCGSLAASDTHLYYTGGHDGSSYFDEVYHASFEEISEGLNVPDIKQYSNPWGDDVYDFADTWYPSNPSISRWGCAMTSANMVLNYHGDDTNPSDLNDWLIEHDGYTRNGAVLWPAISRYSLIDPDTPTLEFTYHPYSSELTKSEIDNNRPPIIKLLNETYGGNHFLVAKGYTGSDININDPGIASNDILSEANSYWGNTVKLGRFVPSETNLSYIVLMIDADFDIKVSSESEEIIGNEYYFKEGPMLNPDNPNEESGGKILNAFYYPKPDSGNYIIEVSGGPGPYQLDSYLYDTNGNVFTTENQNKLSEGEINIFLLNISQDNFENSNLSEVSFNGLLKDLRTAYRSGDIKHRGIYTMLRHLIINAERFDNRGRSRFAKRMLQITNRALIRFTPRFINSESSILLQTKISLLKDSL